MVKFNIHEKVSLSRVSRRYACDKGVVKSAILLYSNGKKLYPQLSPRNSFYNDLEISSDPSFGDQVIPGYVIRCMDSNGVYRETITCTEGMLRKIIWRQ